MDGINGQPIRSKARITTFDMFGCSDAGGHMMGGTLYRKGREEVDKRFKVHFTEEEKMMSSTYRELRGMEEGLTVLVPSVRRKSLYWACDNWASVMAL